MKSLTFNDLVRKMFRAYFVDGWILYEVGLEGWILGCLGGLSDLFLNRYY